MTRDFRDCNHDCATFYTAKICLYLKSVWNWFVFTHQFAHLGCFSKLTFLLGFLVIKSILVLVKGYLSCRTDRLTWNKDLISRVYLGLKCDMNARDNWTVQTKERCLINDLAKQRLHYFGHPFTNAKFAYSRLLSYLCIVSTVTDSYVISIGKK